MATRKYGLILGGGTALGAVQVPIVERLRAEHGCPPSGVVGVSVGAVNALLLGEDRLPDLRAEWEGINGTEDFASKQADIWNGFRSLKPLRRRLEARKAGARLVVPTWAGLVDVATEVYQSIHLNMIPRVEDRHDAAIGSSSQPAFMEEAIFKGRPVMDGGAGGHVLGPLPNWSEMDEIHIVSCSPLGARRRRTRTVEQARGTWTAASVAFALLLGRQADEDVEDLRDAYAGHCPVYLYAPRSWAEVGDPFEAEPEDIAKRFATGEAMYASRERLTRQAPMRRPR